MRLMIAAGVTSHTGGMSIARTFLFLFLALGATVIFGYSGTWNTGEFKPDRDVFAEYASSRPFEREIDRTNAIGSLELLDGFNILDQFQNVRFYTFPTAASSLTGYVSVAIDDKGRVVEVGDPEGFNQITAQLGLTISDKETAEGLARDYLRLRFIYAEAWEGVEGGVRFISSIDEIPFQKDRLDHQIERWDLMLNHRVSSPTTTKMNDGYHFSGFVWRPYDGWVGELGVTVSYNGSVDYERREIAYPYGDYSIGCTFPLDPGPSADVLRRLAQASQAEIRAGVIRYIEEIYSSDWLLHKELVRREDSVLRRIVAQLRDDIDPTVKERAYELTTRIRDPKP